MHAIETASRHKPVALLACFALTLLPLYYGAWQYRTTRKQPEPQPWTYAPVWSDDFINEWLDVHLVQPFDAFALKRYCEKMEWRPNLVLNLADANGGIGNIRGNFLDFFLYAIEAGASIMLPSRASRDQSDWSNVWGGRATFETFFDEEWFLWTMQETCPQMAIYKPKEDDYIETLEGMYGPKSRRIHAEPELTRKTYVQDLDTWLKAREGYTPDEMKVANFGRTLWEFDTRGFPLGLRRTVGQILRINPTVRRMAAVVIQQLAMRYELDINPREPIPKNAFFGAHLRTESDAARAGWLNARNTNFSAQTDAYMQQAVANDLSIMYVASGNATELERFKEKAAAHRPALNVTSKIDLLGPEQLEELQKLTWDQQALVDYEVLQRCSVFGGFVRSSFSYNIALTRNQWLDDHGLAVDPWVVLHSEEAVAFDDGLSRIIGRDEYHELRIPRGMWP